MTKPLPTVRFAFHVSRFAFPVILLSPFVSRLSSSPRPSWSFVPSCLRVYILSALVLCLSSFVTARAAEPASLDAGFLNPPDSAKPHTWWHWMNGNITKEGITADLEAMKRVGIGGAQIFNAAEGIPHGPIQFNSPEWRDMVKHAATEANRLGLELCIHNCGGWSSSGGPWNTPEHAMQIVVSTETHVKGPSHFDAIIPQPKSKLNFYRDIALLAFRTPANEASTMLSASPKPTTSDPALDAAKLIDGKPNTSVALPVPTAGEPQFIQLEFPQPFAARELSLTAGFGMRECKGKFEASDDGKKFRTITDISLAGSQRQTFTFDPVTARFYRVVFTSAYKRLKQLNIAEIELSARPAIDNFAGKTFYDRGGEYRMDHFATASADDVIPRDKLVDLSARMSPDGKLTWDVPEGDWTIIRTGYTPNGATNHPAPAEGTGLECDKLSKEAAEAHWAGLMGKLIDTLGPLAGKTLNNILIDSYEVGTQNWTPKFREEFQKRRGYDPIPFLPILTGRIIDSPEITERFLWDFRRTIADLFSENYSGQFAAMAHRNGMLYSVEPYGNCPTDDMQYGEYGDIPMSEFWPSAGGHTDPGNAKLAASIGHIFGRKFIGAESFTASPEAGKWLKDPYSLKAQGDTVFCAGVNRIIFHRYAHQPWLNRFPGMTMGQWGTHFERTVTWWEQSTAWLKYLARCQYLLQSGHFVGDVCFYCGEGAPNSLHADGMPHGYDYDGFNTDALMTRLSVKDGRIVLPDGASYRIMVLPNETTMTPATLHKIKELADAGATIIGQKPTQSPSLSNYPACDAEVKRLADELWGKEIQNKTPTEALAALQVAPDFEYTPASAHVGYIHRKADDADIYFVSNQREKEETVQCTFRIAGKTPELWYPDTGEIKTAPVYTEADGRTTVPLHFDPAGSIFVVFRKPSDADHVVAVHRSSATPTAATSDLSIVKAEYGYFGDAVNPEAVDVTVIVKKAIADGAKHITAGNDLAGDPAPDVEKELRIEYTVGNEQRKETVAERESIDLPPGVQIIKATYGVLSDEPTAPRQVADVTAKLSSLIADGHLDVHAGSELAGRDPAPLIVKELRVQYRYMGQVKTARVRENQLLELPEDGERQLTPPAYSLAVTDGKLDVQAWQPGVIELKTAAGKSLHAEIAAVPAPIEVTGPWELRFPPNWGAPPQITLDKLISWTAHPDAGVKYFSGTATYFKDLTIPAEDLATGKSIYLDLGQLKNLAQVKLNGKDLGILWKPPFRLDITAAAQPGTNKLEVAITNLWPNRLIGDEQLPEDRVWDGIHLKEWPQWLLENKPSPTGRLTFTTWHHWKKDDTLLPSGLFGPVKLFITQHVEAK
jgi:hypothetical protein